jgi:poly(A) polymerase
LVLGARPNDYDIATSARPEQVRELFPRTVAVGAAFGVVRVVTAAGDVEVATFRQDLGYQDGRHPAAIAYSDELEDARRRDFTINGLFLVPDSGEVVDHVGGLADLAARRLRAIGDPARRFQEDSLRLLRAVRLAARFELEVDPATWRDLVRLAPAVERVSAERIRDELLKMLVERHRRRAFELLHISGLLRLVLPELAACAGVEQPPEFHPEGDVLTHTFLMLDLLREDPAAELALGVLLHDIGKPPTFTRGDRIRFNRHAEVGAELARTVCERLRLSRISTERVVELVRHHLRFKDAPQMRPSTLKRFLRMDHFEDHLELHRVDCLGSHGLLDNYRFCRQKLAEFRRAEVEDGLRPPRLINGHDLINAGYHPGPMFKRALALVEDLQLEGRVRTRQEALDELRRRLPPEE